MTSSSDEWLVALLDEKSPHELTAAELAAIHERAAISPAVRQALMSRIQLEEALHAALGPPNVSGAAIARQVSRRRRGRMISVAAMLALLIAGGSALWFAVRGPERPPGQEEVATAPKPEKRQPETQRSAERNPGGQADQVDVDPIEAARPSNELARATAQEPPPVAPESKVETDPWNDVLGDDAPVVPFATSAFAAFGETVPGYDVADDFPAAALRRWVLEASGRPLNTPEGQWRDKTFAGVEGMAKLLPPWRDDAVLRIAPFDIAEFALHFWSGEDGVSVRFYPHQRPQLLAAYAVSRDGEDPAPKRFRLLATDGGSYSRGNTGAIEIRHQAGQLVVTHGAISLLAVPMQSPPREVFLEGRMRLRTLSMYRGEPAPLAQRLARRDLLPETALDQLDWLTSNEPAPKIEKAAERITLSAPESAQPQPRKLAWAAVPLPAEQPSGLCEAVFRLDEVNPGTGVYLGDENGTPVHTLFMTENNAVSSPMVMYGWTSRDGNVPEPRWRWDLDPKHEMTPVVGSGSWIKVVIGPGGLKAYVSGDGEHWGPCSRSPERAIRGSFASVGLFAMADGKPRSIGLSRVQVRELSGISSAAPEELRRRVPGVEEPFNRPADWLTWATATCPRDIALEDWLAACSVETLARGEASETVLNAVLDGLIARSIDADRPIEETLALLADAALLSDLWNNRAPEFAGHYDRLASRVTQREANPATTAALLSIGEAYLASPIWTESRPWAMPPAVLRNVAASAVWSNDGNAAAAARRIAFYLSPSHPESGWSTDEDSGLARVASWAAEVATAGPQQLDGASRFGRGHPLSTEPDREATAVALELEAALAAGAYGDVARLLGTIADLSGLMPALGEPGRFVPPARLIAEVASRHPGLVETIEKESGPVGMLSVRQAIAAQDEAAVRTAALRYVGTAAAVEANRWLGDASLSLGHFADAVDYFAEARRVASPDQQDSLTARLRLAETLAGEEAKAGDAKQTSFGPRTLSRQEFNGLIDDLRKSRHTNNDESNATRSTIPAPVAVAPQARGRFDGDLGRNPGRGEFRRYDWAGRQIGVTADRGILYLTNRFQVVAFDPKRRVPWWTVGLGKEQGEAHAWPNVAFTPVVQKERLYVRRLTSRGPELACLHAAEGGKVLWKTRPELAVVSDPIIVNGRLLAITAPTDRRGGGLSTLSLTLFRFDDGTVIGSVPLFVMSNPDTMQPPVEMTPTKDGFILTTLGTAARCDFNGNLVWIRRLPFLPPAADPESDRLPYSRPILAGDRVIVAPPGSRAVLALDAETGRQLWSRPLGELEGLCGLTDSVVVVRGPEDVLGIDPATGETRWTFHRENLLAGLICDGETVLASARTELQQQQDGLSLLRIDAATGSLLAEQTVRVQRKEEIRCGPLFVENGNVWGFIGEGWRDPKRTLVEFVPDASLPPLQPADDPAGYHGWLAHVEPPTEFNTASVLPGWTPVGSQSSGNSKKGTEFRDEYRGEKWVLVTKAGRDQSARFMKRMKLSAGQPKLSARVGRSDDDGWTLRLLVDGKPIVSEPVNKKTAPEGWRTVTFDLSRFAGEDVRLMLDQSPPSDRADRTTEAFWKRIAIE